MSIEGIDVLHEKTLVGVVPVITDQERLSANLWHQMLSHINEKGLYELSKQGLLENHKLFVIDFCEHCIYGKACRVKFEKGLHNTKGIWDYIYLDLWGPTRVTSTEGGKYFLSLVDDYSRRVWVYILKQKNEAFEKFKQWKILIKNQTGRKMKKRRTYNGLEFCENLFIKFCSNNGIARHLIVSKNSQQMVWLNGWIELFWNE